MRGAALRRGLEGGGEAGAEADGRAQVCAGSRGLRGVFGAMEGWRRGEAARAWVWVWSCAWACEVWDAQGVVCDAVCERREEACGGEEVVMLREEVEASGAEG